MRSQNEMERGENRSNLAINGLKTIGFGSMPRFGAQNGRDRRLSFEISATRTRRDRREREY